MPYHHELANSIGFFDLLTEENKDWLEGRLKTYAHGTGEKDREELFNSILVSEPEALAAPHKFKQAVAIDGSLATVENPNVTALKIASVWKDLNKEPVYVNGVLNPQSIVDSIETFASVGLIPGKGIYSKGEDGSWDMKFREEFYQNLRHIQIHNNDKRYSLMAYARKVFAKYADENELTCPNCSKGKIHFDTEALILPCDVCLADIYFSDYITKALFTAREQATHPMLVLERLLLHAIVEEAVANKTAEDTLFIADGSLQFFKLPELAKIMLERTQQLDTFPAVVSFMKSGRVQDFLEYPGIDDHIKPGTVAMITSDAWKMLFKSRAGEGIYGKSFAYRTKDGHKWFSFMMTPKLGSPEDNAPILNDWVNYPHISSVCAFIEANKSNENGHDVATLEIIGQANSAASLPAVLSRKFLQELVNDVIYS